jgi:hypothetical protein
LYYLFSNPFSFSFSSLVLQVFPLRQSALSNHKLRVKLVGLHNAAIFSSGQDFAPDVFDLGRTMLWIITNSKDAMPAPTPISKRGVCSASAALSPEEEECIESLRSYDPSLMLLLQWMTDPNPGDRADMMDVLRHP